MNPAKKEKVTPSKKQSKTVPKKATNERVVIPKEKKASKKASSGVTNNTGDNNNSASVSRPGMTCTNAVQHGIPESNSVEANREPANKKRRVALVKDAVKPGRKVGVQHPSRCPSKKKESSK